MIPRLPPTASVRTEIIEVLHGLAADLAKWLHGQFLRHGGKNWWNRHVCEVVQERDQQRIADGEWSELEDLDLGALLNLLQSNFRFLTSRRALNKDDRDTIRAMKEARNRCEGHWPLKGLPLNEIMAHLEALREFSRMLGGCKNRGEQIRALTSRIEQSGSVDLRPTDPSPAGKSLSPMIPIGGKRLADYFGTDQLTNSQREAVDRLQRFLEDPDEQCFILRGYAGTGKTYLIGGLVRYLSDLHRKPEMMAPTGRAAHVLRERHHVDATTIHRTIYSLAALKDYRELDESGDITFKFYFDLKNNDIDHDTVFIVDEASMISDVFSESEFMHFGSGRLLPDLLRFINFDGNDYRKKLILVGDNAQLPPVGMNFSPALDRDYLEKKCLIKSSDYELTDVIRQLDSSPILANATEMRRMLRENRFQKFDFTSDGEAIRELPPDRFIETFVRERDANSFSDTVIVAYKNETTKTYNEAVRARLFPGMESLTAQDQIIVVRNNYNYERAMLNGQMGLVVATDDQLETRTVPLNVGLDEEGKRKIESIKLQFRNATLRFSDDRGKPFDITCKISEDCLLNGLSDLPSLYSKALYVDFQQRNPGLKPRMPEFKEALKADPYFNAVMLKFGYAITCHKAQGGEWRTVFIDFSGKNKLDAESMRWSYTALTRAEVSVVATNALHQSILKPQIPITKPDKETKTLALPDEDADDLPTDLKPAVAANPPDAIRGLMDSALPSGWEIATSRNLPYQEMFTLVADGDIITVSVYYNSKDRISKVQISPTPGKPNLCEMALKAFGALKGCSLGLRCEEQNGLIKEQEEFAESLRQKIEAANIQVVSLESKSPYHLMARLRAGGDEGEVNYYFDKRWRFTRYMPLPNCPQRIVDQLEDIHA